MPFVNSPRIEFAFVSRGIIFSILIIDCQSNRMSSLNLVIVKMEWGLSIVCPLTIRKLVKTKSNNKLLFLIIVEYFIICGFILWKFLCYNSSNNDLSYKEF